VRTTVTVNDDLFKRASSLCAARIGHSSRRNSLLFNESLEALIREQSALQLAQLQGSEPNLEAPVRNR
jgi:hypothetical protein